MFWNCKNIWWKYSKVLSMLIPVVTCSACQNESKSRQLLGLMPEQTEVCENLQNELKALNSSYSDNEVLKMRYFKLMKDNKCVSF